MAAGLALFSMFFGAGDLIWPLILGGATGDKSVFSMLGLLVTGVSLPLLGLVSMLLFHGNYRAFFNRLGKVPGFILLLVIQLILGPIGSIPRLFTLSHSTVAPYFPDISLMWFSIIASILVFAFVVRKQKIIEILGLVLTPMLLLTLGSILFLGFWNLPTAPSNAMSAFCAFKEGAGVGYNTLDLIASFIFAPLVLSHFIPVENGVVTKQAVKKMFQASLIAAALLSIIFIGLTLIAGHYTQVLPPHAREERLAAISLYLMGPKGAMFSCIAVAMACLTTAIPLVTIAADYVKNDLLGRFGDKLPGGNTLPALLVLGVSAALANLGFMGIANMLSPILQVLCPGLIILAVLNILHKMFGLNWSRAPVYAAFAISTVSHILNVA
ncbi:MAG: branched-chain amino acid transport system II carrier protein [Parachlamydiales bacterium]|nr:branched-chain amino acid transport system II carrier protein [Parachlamydiales bacterium]